MQAREERRGQVAERVGMGSWRSVWLAVTDGWFFGFGIVLSQLAVVVEVKHRQSVRMDKVLQVSLRQEGVGKGNGGDSRDNKKVKGNFQ